MLNELLLLCRFSAFTLHVTQWRACNSRCKNLFCLHILSKWQRESNEKKKRDTLFHRTDPSTSLLTVKSNVNSACKVRWMMFHVQQYTRIVLISKLLQCAIYNGKSLWMCNALPKSISNRFLFFGDDTILIGSILFHFLSACLCVSVSKIDCKWIFIERGVCVPVCDGITIYWTE